MNTTPKIITFAPGDRLIPLTFRAECLNDWHELRKILERDYSYGVVSEHSMTLNDMGEPTVKLVSLFTVRQLRRVMRQVPDSHVMIETLNHSLFYTGTRNYGAK